MFTTGFSMQVEKLAEEMQGPTVKWMLGKASEFDAVITGSLIIRENNSFFNRMVWVEPDQQVRWYDKKHLFTMGEEHLNYSSGNRRVTLDWKGWKFRLLICYDLRFPVWSRNNDDYDVLVYAANWPSAKHQVWKTLLVARALENQCYCIGANRVGKDEMGLNYSGDSAFISPRGEAAWLGNAETSLTFSLSPDDLRPFRKKFPVLKDRDRFLLE